jgi:hypothetical protein
VSCVNYDIAGAADGFTVPTVCPIAARLPSKVSNATVLMKFRMIASPEIDARRYSRRGASI